MEDGNSGSTLASSEKSLRVNPIPDVSESYEASVPILMSNPTLLSSQVSPEVLQET